MKKIRDSIPTPTLEKPYAQLWFLFENYSKKLLSKISIKGVRSGVLSLEKYLKTNDLINPDYKAGEPFDFSMHVGKYFLIDYKDYLSSVHTISGKRISEQTEFTRLRHAKQIISYACEHKLINQKPYSVCIPDAKRETDAAYSEKEYCQILDAMSCELMLNEGLKPYLEYIKKGVGRNPYQMPKMKPGSKWPNDYGWNTQNTIFYFENVLNCIPIRGFKSNIAKHRSFFVKGLRKYKNGYDNFYKDLGILEFVSADIIGIYVLKLVLETGLNPSSVLNLNIDCFGYNHPITKRSYIKYFKPRSNGHKEYLFFGKDEEKPYDISSFDGVQSSIIEETITTVIRLTSEMRKRASEEMIEKLFIFESMSNKSFGKVHCFNNRASSKFCKYLIGKYNLKDSSGNELALRLNRFRPTRATMLVQKGHNIFRVQIELGHKSMSTTLKYISLLRLEKDFQNDIDLAFNSIYRTKLLPQYKSSSDNEIDNSKIYKGFLTDCKNVFDPPIEIDTNKKKPCTKFHMCFFCKNIVVSAEHLPQVYRYYLDILSSKSFIEHNLPNQEFYEKTVEIIKSIFDPSVSEFSRKEIDLAISKAENLRRFFLDPLVSNGYCT